MKAIAHMLILGKHGNIAFIHIGYGESELPKLVDGINELLAKETPAG